MPQLSGTRRARPAARPLGRRVRPRRSPALDGLGRELDAKRPGHLQNGVEARLGPGRERLVQALTAKTRILDTLRPEFIEYMLSRIPRARFLEVEEAASMITWLCTSENSFTTGAIFDLSGGRATY